MNGEWEITDEDLEEIERELHLDELEEQLEDWAVE